MLKLIAGVSMGTKKQEETGLTGPFQRRQVYGATGVTGKPKRHSKGPREEGKLLTYRVRACGTANYGQSLAGNYTRETPKKKVAKKTPKSRQCENRRTFGDQKGWKNAKTKIKN